MTKSKRTEAARAASAFLMNLPDRYSPAMKPRTITAAIIARPVFISLVTQATRRAASCEFKFGDNQFLHGLEFVKVSIMEAEGKIPHPWSFAALLSQ